MFCRYCGEQISNEVKFCPNCGEATPAGEQSVMFQEKKPVEQPNPQPIQQSGQSVIVKPVKKKKIPAIVIILCIPILLVVVANILVFIVPTVQSQIIGGRFKHVWTCDYNSTEMTFDFPRNTLTIEELGVSVNYNMEWKLKGDNLTLTINGEKPETYQTFYSDNYRTLELVGTHGLNKRLKLTRVK